MDPAENEYVQEIGIAVVVRSKQTERARTFPLLLTAQRPGRQAEVTRTRERNRLLAVRARAERLDVVVNDIEVNIRHLERRIELLTTAAVTLAHQHPELQRAFARLTPVRGIATHSAVQLLPELLVLPDDMTVRQWVAHAGLAPAPANPARASTSQHASRSWAMRTAGGPCSGRRSWRCDTSHTSRRSSTSSSRGARSPSRPTSPSCASSLHAIYGMCKTNTDFVAEEFHAAA